MSPHYDLQEKDPRIRRFAEVIGPEALEFYKSRDFINRIIAPIMTGGFLFGRELYNWIVDQREFDPDSLTLGNLSKDYSNKGQYPFKVIARELKDSGIIIVDDSCSTKKTLGIVIPNLKVYLNGTDAQIRVAVERNYAGDHEYVDWSVGDDGLIRWRNGDQNRL